MKAFWYNVDSNHGPQIEPVLAGDTLYAKIEQGESH
jgi:hypothetical protein